MPSTAASPPTRQSAHKAEKTRGLARRRTKTRWAISRPSKPNPTRSCPILGMVPGIWNWIVDAGYCRRGQVGVGHRRQRAARADLQAADSVGATTARPERSNRGLTDGGAIGQQGANLSFPFMAHRDFFRCVAELRHYRDKANVEQPHQTFSTELNLLGARLPWRYQGVIFLTPHNNVHGTRSDETMSGLGFLEMAPCHLMTSSASRSQIPIAARSAMKHSWWLAPQQRLNFASHPWSMCGLSCKTAFNSER
jgi:hypothetical protein